MTYAGLRAILQDTIRQPAPVRRMFYEYELIGWILELDPFQEVAK